MLLDIRYRSVILKISDLRGWNISHSMIKYNGNDHNGIIIEFDKIPLVKKLIERDKLNPRKEYIYKSPDNTIAFDCNHIYGLLHIQMLNIIERYLKNNNRKLWDELCTNHFKVYFYITEISQSMQYKYSYHTLKVDEKI